MKTYRIEIDGDQLEQVRTLLRNIYCTWHEYIWNNKFFIVVSVENEKNLPNLIGWQQMIVL